MRTPIDNLTTAQFDYELPRELIAQAPTARRDGSRLMVLAGSRIEHRSFADLPQYLDAGDVLVLNETRVIRARLLGRRLGAGGLVELLLLHPAESLRYEPSARRWIALARPSRRLRPGDRVIFEDLGEAVILRDLDDGLREIELKISTSLEDFLERFGRMPLPPYVRNDSREAQERYQTVFARVPGSVAAPTASLHFTPELLADIERRGIQIVRLTLDVGLGTFRPVSVEAIEKHAMHPEVYEITAEAALALQAARAANRRIVAVGTTVVRAIEGNIAAFKEITAGRHTTDLFIRPGFHFRAIGAMVTNFHLPRSTLLMLVSAFGGLARIREAYARAISLRYRFYSFGDAMLITGRQ